MNLNLKLRLLVAHCRKHFIL